MLAGSEPIMSISHEYHLPLDPARHQELIAALGDRPETGITVHHLRRGSCRAYVAGDPVRFDGAIIQHFDTPTEPTGFGTDPQVLDRLLQAMQGWGRSRCGALARTTPHHSGLRTSSVSGRSGDTGM
jgi:hypothetical protein